MKKCVVIGLVVMVLLPAAKPALAAKAVIWDAEGCHESVALQPAADRLGSGAVLVVLAYRCDSALIGDSVFRNFAVSEISVMYATGGWELLRQVTNNKTLSNKLRALGLDASHFGQIDYALDPATGQLDVEVSYSGASYLITGIGGEPGDPQPTSGGAAYTYEGRKGTIQLFYENEMQSANAAILTLDAAHDDELRRWLGRDSATGTGIAARGDWTGTAALIP